MPKGTEIQVKEQHKRRRIRIREYIKDCKKDKACVSCGYKEHTEILQFHHNQGDKEIDLSKAAKWNMSKERIDKEISLCILLCPNCHMWLHFKDAGKNRKDNIKRRR